MPADSAAYAYIFWTPIIINALMKGVALEGVAVGGAASLTSINAVLLTAVPYTLATIALWLTAVSSQRRNEVYYHASLGLFIGGIAFALFPVMAKAHVALGFVSLIVTITAAASGNPAAIAIVHELNQGAAQVLALPLFNTMTILGGFMGPYLTGALVQRLGGFTWPAVIFGILLIMTGSLLLCLKFWVSRDARKHRHAAATQQRQDSEAVHLTHIPHVAVVGGTSTMSATAVRVVVDAADKTAAPGAAAGGRHGRVQG